MFTLDNSNYYSQEANKKFMSVSQYKTFLDCEARAIASINGEYTEEPTTALLVGSYVDSYFEGTLDLYRNTHEEIFTKKGDLRAEYKQAELIIQRIEQDKLFMEYMSGEKQVIFTAELFGCLWKTKIDSYFTDRIVDLKCMRSLERIMGKSLIEHWRYDIQGAIYTEIEYRATSKKRRSPFYLAIATKEPVTNLEIVHIPDYQLDDRLLDVAKHMPRILVVKSGLMRPERCGVCDYCKQTKVLTEPILADDLGFSEKELKLMKGVI